MWAVTHSLPWVTLFFVAVNLAALAALLIHYLILRQQLLRRGRLAEQLRQLQHFPQRYQRLLKILLSTKTFRVESLWKRLTAEEIQRIGKSEIPNRLRRMAKRGSKWQRVRAILLLGLLQDSQAIGLLRTLTVDRDEDIALAAVSALGRYNEESSARYLLGLLSHRYRLNASRVASVLEGMRLDLSPLLLEMLVVGDLKSRFWAATLLGRYDSAKVRSALVETLKAEDPNTRAAALDSLGRVGDKQCADSVIAALSDEVWYVRAHAALTAGKVQIHGAIDKLIECLSDPVWWVRHDAAKGLEMLLQTDDKSRRVVNALLAHIDDADPFARNMIASLLSNNGTVAELMVHFKKLGQQGDDARRLLAFIYASGGAPALQHDQDWQNFFQSTRKVLAP